MNYTLLTIILIVLTVVPIIIGALSANKELLVKYNQGLSDTYILWIILKRSLFNAVTFGFFIGLLTVIVESNFWYYIAFIIYPFVNFYYARFKVKEEFDIMLKSGEGLLTPEGWAKAGSGTSNTKPSNSSNNHSSTLIYSSPYGGSLIGKIDNLGVVYTSGIGSSCIGHVDDSGYVYDRPSGGSVVARYQSDGNVYSGSYGGNHLGKIKGNGEIYNTGLIDSGTCVAKASGPNVFAAGAAYLSLFR